MNQDFNRVFDRVRPSSGQKEAILARLLEPERKGSPMKHMKKLAALGAAAALTITACAAAVATGLDQRLADYFGVSPRQAELLLPGAAAVDVTAEDNGAAFHITQVLRDRYSIAAVADFTAPEGTVLDVNGPIYSFGGIGHIQFLTETGTPVEAPAYRWEWYSLDDGNPEDNHLSILFYLNIPEGLDPEVASLALPAEDLMVFDWTGPDDHTPDRFLEVPLPQTDMGYTQPFDQPVGELDGAAIRLKEVYLSPITMMVTLERESEFSFDLSSEEGTHQYERWAFALDGEHFAAVNGYEPAVDRAVLTSRDGEQIPLECRDGSADLDSEAYQYHHVFRLTEAADVAQLQGGTLTLRVGESSVEIPLDNLTPAE